MLKIINFYIAGTHCIGCKTLIETEVGNLAGIKRVGVDYRTGKTEVGFDTEKITKEKIFEEIEKLNYKIKNDNQEKSDFNKKSYFYAILIFLAISLLIVGYFVIQNLGSFELLASLNEGHVAYSLIFIIGLLAGFHCVGMCGGLVVAYSAGNLKNDNRQKRFFLPHLQYNTGRLISYTIIGGILGGLGSFFGINPAFTGFITLIAGVFMVTMGLSFIFNLEILQKIKLRTPQLIAKCLYSQKHSKKSKGPIVVGLLNGFMPCGPLQAMQLYALASGSMARGAASMAIYALGTIPLMLGFGAFISLINKRHIKNIIKFSGVLVIVLGIFMANRGLANFGYRVNILNLKNSSNQDDQITPKQTEEFQIVNMDLTYSGYKPNVLYIKKGIPVRWVINVVQMSGCTNAIMIESLGIKKDLKYGENVIEFIPPDNVNEIKFSCWMRMVWGKFIVTDNISSVPKNTAQAAPADLNLPQEVCSGSGTCGGTCGAPSCGCGLINSN